MSGTTSRRRRRKMMMMLCRCIWPTFETLHSRSSTSSLELSASWTTCSFLSSSSFSSRLLRRYCNSLTTAYENQIIISCSGPYLPLAIMQQTEGGQNVDKIKKNNQDRDEVFIFCSRRSSSPDQTQ